MSVVLPSPLQRPKRLLDEDTTFDLSPGQQNKRSRIQRSPAPASLRCGLPFHQGDPVAAPTQQQAYHALLALFPGMDEKVVQGVLVECNYSIDAAIKRLTDLKLTTEDATVAAATAAASSSTQADAGPSPHAAKQTEDGQPANEPAAPEAGPQTADQWIEFLVAEMLAAKDMTDARSRAALVLQHFERFVKQRQKQESDSKMSELLKENAIYKRAVQIQAARMEAKKGQDEEMTQLRHAVAQYQEQCRKLELHAYSLAMHLQQATSSGSGVGMHQRHPPDVF